MSENEWFNLGTIRVLEWEEEQGEDYPLSTNEASAFEYAWELAGREMGIVK